ncbi:MAG: preprotein translocase subunit SecG [Planctomycetota bacterium]|jgi:preprotein translocase subunit SecG
MPIGVLSQYIFGSLLFILSFLIIAIILLQRGRGGGLTGALGGLGGQSAFGVKAGDIFTRITAVLVLLWITVCALAAWWYKENNLDIQADTSASTSVSSGMGSSGVDLPPNSESTLPGLPTIPGVPSIPPASTPVPPDPSPAQAQPSAPDPSPAPSTDVPK